MILLFWLSVLLVVYTYLGYPLLIWLLARISPQPACREPEQWPGVSIVVPFCNESGRVVDKLATLRGQDYPGPVQLIFVSDGEEDDTAAVVRDCASAGVDTLVLPQRGGKAAALNAAIEKIRHDLVMYTDARQQLAADALRRLVTRISAPGTGAVSGELVLLDDHDQARIGLYWRYEKWIRQSESRVASVPGVTGALYLIRREYIRVLPTDTLLDDFEMPLPAIQAGQRVVFDSGALVYDRVSADIDKEKARKVRTLTGNFQSFLRHGWLFLPWRNPICWQFLSHKVARLLVPYALLLILIGALVIPGAFYTFVWWLQVGFYLLALGKARGWPGFSGGVPALALLFTELNLAAVIAAWRYLSGHVDARWERTA